MSNPEASTSALRRHGSPTVQFELPCTLKGLSAGLAAGSLGFVFGFVPSLIKLRDFGQWRVMCGEGWQSAKAMAICSGLYTMVQCISQRVRQRDDVWNRCAGGCSTGLVLGWSAGPMAAVQSCLGFGLLTYVFDFGGAGDPRPAKAATLLPPAEGTHALKLQPGGVKARRQGVHKKLGSGLGVKDMLKVPPVMWLGPVFNTSYLQQQPGLLRLGS